MLEQTEEKCPEAEQLLNGEAQPSEVQLVVLEKRASRKDS